MLTIGQETEPIPGAMPRGRFSHWSAQYLVSRVRLALYEWTHADVPWLTGLATEFLANWLRDSDVGLEWGSGRSTIWFSDRVARLTSIEHDPVWHRQISDTLARAGRNVDYRLVNDVDPATHREHYISEPRDLGERSLDFVLVDGLYRAGCMLTAIPLLRPGGLLILDNANWYYPHHSRSPDSVGTNEPSPEWRLIREQLRPWRLYWTSSGVWDTALFFKPC